MLLTAGGEVLGCGCTEQGQLGVHAQGLRAVSSPQPIPLQSREERMWPALAVACGDHSLVVCCVEAQLPGSLSALHACNTALCIPDLLTLAKAAKPLSGPDRLLQDPGSQAQALIDLSEAVRNVFSNPGLLISGFSIPQATRAAYDYAATSTEGQLNLDLDAIKDVYDSILMVLNPDVVDALQSTITALLQRIRQQEELTASHSRPSALRQAEWLKVCASVRFFEGFLLCCFS